MSNVVDPRSPVAPREAPSVKVARTVPSENFCTMKPELSPILTNQILTSAAYFSDVSFSMQTPGWKSARPPNPHSHGGYGAVAAPGATALVGRRRADLPG